MPNQTDPIKNLERLQLLATNVYIYIKRMENENKANNLFENNVLCFLVVSLITYIHLLLINIFFLISR